MPDEGEKRVFARDILKSQVSPLLIKCIIFYDERSAMFCSKKLSNNILF